MSMPSEELQLIMAGYVLGDLSPEEAVAFERVLATNPEVATEVAQMQNALEVSYIPPEVMPPAHLRSTILDQARTELGRSHPPARRRLAWRGVMEVAAAAAIVALGVHNYRLQLALQSSQIEARHYKTLTYLLQATQKGSPAAAQVVVNPNNLEAAISVNNLPPLPPGQVYALWTLVQPGAPFTTDSKQAILTGVFTVDDRGNYSQTIPVPKAFRSQELVTKVAVTIEAANAPQNHTGKPVMITGL